MTLLNNVLEAIRATQTPSHTHSQTHTHTHTILPCEWIYSVSVYRVDKTPDLGEFWVGVCETLCRLWLTYCWWRTEGCNQTCRGRQERREREGQQERGGRCWRRSPAEGEGDKKQREETGVYVRTASTWFAGRRASISNRALTSG